MRPRIQLIVLYVLLGVLFITLLSVMIRILENQRSVAESERRRYESSKVADLLRQTSDDLTRMARTYVVTGDPKYETYFNDILAIRNGEKPRPVGYDGIYWDYVLATGEKPTPDGEPISFEQLMLDLSFSDVEFQKLREAEKASNDLTKMEAVAINAVKGRFDDGSGTFPVEGAPDLEMARRIMHGDEYHVAKAEIMEQIDEFMRLVEARTAQELRRLQERVSFYIQLEIALIALLFLTTLFSYFVLRGERQESEGRILGSEEGMRLRILLTSTATMAVIALAVGSACLVLLYRASFHREATDLREMAVAHARLIDAVARFDQVYSENDVEGGAGEATLSQIVEAHEKSFGTGETGEYLLGRVEDGKIVFLLDRRFPPDEDEIPFTGNEMAEPMRRAISGESGTVVALDYRGEKVLAGFAPVPALGAGFVVKRDLSEIRASFIRVGIIAGAAALLLVFVGASLIVRFNNPLIRNVVDSTIKLRRANQQLEADIADRQRVEAELRKLISAVEQSPSTVIITDTEGNIEYVNPRFSQVTGYARDEVIGRNPRLLKSGRHPDAFYTGLWKTITSGREWRGEICNRKKNGEIYWEATSISPVRGPEGEIGYFVAVKEDVTERKRYEEALKQARDEADTANRAKSEFLARMSHEIRTPMNAIIGMSYLALQTDLTPKQHDYLTKVQSSARALLRIIDDILDFSKIEAGKMTMESIGFSLEDVLSDLAGLVALRAGEKGLEVLFDTDPDVPNLLTGDPLRLEQVLINLTNNAVKFTESGEIVVKTNVEERQDDRVVLEFSVRDTGIGITEEQRDRLFQSFSQADGSITREYGGTGLGLSICKRLVDMMDGEIEVTSEPGKGSNFSFTARFRLQGAEEESRQYRPDPDLVGIRSLVVDDSEASREILEAALTSFSFEVTTVASGEEAVAEVGEAVKRGDPYRLVVMDWKLPGLDGIEAATRIRTELPPDEMPRIVMVTAYGSEEVIGKAEQAGLDGLLTKPFGRSSLFDTIIEAFGRKVDGHPHKAERSGFDRSLIERIRGARVLLVEDNEINQQVAAEIMKMVSVSVNIANNGLEGVQQVLSGEPDDPFDAVLMDVRMPEMDGYAATQEIRRDERFRDLPIIGITAHAMRGDREKCLDAGMNDHVTKPIDPGELIEALGRWITPRERPVTGVGESYEVSENAGWRGIPDLPGIDVDDALERIGGNTDLFRRMLIMFRRDHALATEEIRRALEDGDRELAHRVAHTVKGVAGNVGANGLFEVARDLEMAIREGREPTEDLARFGQVLDELMEELEAVDLEETQT